MSYNTLGFDKYGWIKGENEAQKVIALVSEEDPDIVCFQEFEYQKRDAFPQYPYSYVNYSSRKESQVVQAIFSKYPILEKGSLDFPDSHNNAIFADILYKNDTLRIYNIHLQSFRVIPSRRILRHLATGQFYKHIARAFTKQEEQAALLYEHRQATPYKTILCGDFNNTQYSRVYRIVKGDLIDSFLEKGSGFGRTYNLKFLPLRIDAILASPSVEVEAHRNFDIRLSDHYPIMASFLIH
jgi:endonuclease/exonuclease/phosphatase family metal-dependent hydrolase